MLKSVRDLQNRAVMQLKACLLQSKSKKTFTFKAPTGSGKTYMMAHFCDELLSLYPNSVFIISSLSKGGLATQNYEKFEEYTEKGFFKHLDSFLIKTEVTDEQKIDIPKGHNIYFLPRDLYKRTSRLKERGDVLVQFIKSFKQQYSDASYSENDFALVPSEEAKDKRFVFLIKDECHIATNNLDGLNKYFDKIINFSATPNLKKRQFPDVEITNEEAENVSLIKKVEWNEDENAKFEDVLEKFKDLKKKYLNMVEINPCLIVQISNRNKADEEVRHLKEVLSKTDLKWMLIVDKEKDCDTNDSLKLAGVKSVAKWKDYAKEETSGIDIIIFKMVITEGYDIPRACMLYQVRETQSETLDEQVVGRVRRNPKLLTFETLSKDAQNLITTAYVYGVKSENCGKTKEIHLQTLDIENRLTFKTTTLKTLKKSTDFNVENFVSKKSEPVVSHSIFSLQRKLKNTDDGIEDLVYSYADDSEKWWKTVEYIDEIQDKSQAYSKNYNESLEITKDENGKESVFSLCPSFIINEKESQNKLVVKTSVWRIYNGTESSYKFSFDSEAEEEWAEILQELEEKAESLSVANIDFFVNTQNTIYLWGKNYPTSSPVKFPYYNDGVHESYPDFIFKDKKGNLHFFEVKSVNVATTTTIDKEEYENKIRALKEAYKATSKKLEGYNFYLSIKEKASWNIFKYSNGEETNLSLEEFRDTFRDM